MKNILLVEDHPLIQIGIEEILNRHIQGSKIFIAEDFATALQFLEKQKFELVVMDINIPGGDNVEMIYTVRMKQADIPILVCSGYDETLYGIPFLRAGANGYISKTAGKDEFRNAIDHVMTGKIYASPKLMQSAFVLLFNTKVNHNQSPVNDLLSEKEIEIAKLLNKGISTKTISELINLSPPSISTYKTKIFKKLGISNIVELATFFKLNS